MHENYKSAILTIIQYLTLIHLFIWCRWFAGSYLLISFQVAGLILGIWSILVMTQSKLNITPVPRPKSILVETGPYKIIRHPMYLSLLLFLVPMILSNLSFEVVVIFAIFTINLFVKLLYEEKLLHRYFNNYDSYSEKTWRLIPLVF